MSDCTVIVPCYNAASTLADALDSVAAQTCQPAQVLVIDDGSTDGSDAIATSYPFVTLVAHIRNQGIGAASNTGLSWATSPVVALLDADDVWLPNHVDLVSGLLYAHPEADFAFGCSQTFGSGPLWQLERVWGKKTACVGPTDIWTDCFDTVVVPGSAGIVRRAALEAVGGWAEGAALKVAPDYDLWLRLALNGLAVWEPTVTVRYRQHAQQMSFRDPIGQWEAIYASRLAVMEEAHRRHDPRAAVIEMRFREQFARDYVRVLWTENGLRRGILDEFLSGLRTARILSSGRSKEWLEAVRVQVFQEDEARRRHEYRAAGLRFGAEG